MQTTPTLHKHKRASFLAQLTDLTLIELTSWRWSWRSMLITGMLAPLGSMTALGTFGRDSGPEALSYILTGNVVLALMFENLNKVQGHFTYMRFNGTLDYFASLPIHKYAVILAVLSAFLVLALPSLTVTVLFGSVFLGIPLSISPLLLVVVPLCAVPLAGAGALIGVSVRTPPEGDSLSLILTMGMLGMGPVIIPPDRLPGFMLALGRLSPATYAASAMRQVLLGPVTGQIALDLLVLAGFSLLAFGLAGRKMDWRQK
ncbi:MAG: ABC transporter permease [Anaerolineae bacterium]|nr:ABC transporter permease [Anaerolineae bacterium]